MGDLHEYTPVPGINGQTHLIPMDTQIHSKDLDCVCRPSEAVGHPDRVIHYQLSKPVLLSCRHESICPDGKDGYQE